MIKKKQIIAIILNIILIITEIIGIILSIKTVGFTFEFYTIDSNMLALLCSIIYLGYITKSIIRKEYVIPRWLKLFKYMTVTSLTLTLLVVIFILTPMMREVGGLKVMLFSGAMLYHHTLCPIIAIVSFLFFEESDVGGKCDRFFATSITIIYAVIITILNIMKVVKGPYPFLYVYEQPIYISIIWFIVILGGTYGIASLLEFWKKRFFKR